MFCSTQKIILFTLGILLMPMLASAQVLNSTNFQIEGSALNSGGNASVSSSNFEIPSGSFGEVLVGESSSANFTAEGGTQEIFGVLTAPTLTPTPTPDSTVAGVSTGGGGGLVGSSIGPAALLSPHINAYNVPLSIVPSQSGTLFQNFFDRHSAQIDVPSLNILSQTIFTITKRIVMPDAIQEIIAVDVELISNDVFRVTATDENGNPVTSFSQPISIIITIPDMPDNLTDIGLYFLDTDALLWRLIPDAVFSTDSVTFFVNHLTDFAIFRALGRPETLPLTQAPSVCSGADFNTDGTVDLVDFGILIFFWNSTNPINPCVDTNSDGLVELVDFGVLIFEWSG